MKSTETLPRNLAEALSEAESVHGSLNWSLWTQRGQELSIPGLLVAIVAIPTMYFLAKRKIAMVCATFLLGCRARYRARGRSWQQIADGETRDTGLGLHSFDLTAGALLEAHRVDFTFQWCDTRDWARKDYCVAVEPAI